MRLTFENIGSRVVVHLADALTSDNSDGVISQLRSHFHQHKPAAYVLDLSAVTQLDSAGIGALVSSLHHVRSAGSDLCLAGVAGRVLMTLQVARADRLFTVHATLQDALAAP